MKLTRTRQMSLRAKVTLAIVLPLLIILGAFTAIEQAHHRNMVLDNLSLLAGQSGRVIESSLRHAMLESDFDEVQSVVDTLGDSEQFQALYLLDPTGKVIFSPGRLNVGMVMVYEDADCQPCHLLPVAERPESIVVSPTNAGQVFRSMHPITNEPECARCHDPNQRILGLLLTDISMAPMENALRDDLTENILWWVVTVVTSILVVNIVMSQLVLKRLKKVSAAITGFGLGHMPESVKDPQHDEIGMLAATFATMAERVSAREAENTLLAEQVQVQSKMRGNLLQHLITAQEDERKRVARELHDGLGQALTGLSYRAEAIEGMLRRDPDRASDQIGEMRSLVSETTHQMYDLILDLRPSALDDLGLIAALRAYASQVLGRHDISLDIRINGTPDRLPSTVETALYRIYQESLTNIVKHASATRVRLIFMQTEDCFKGKIVDNGKGFDPAAVDLTGQKPRGLGMLGMQERAAHCGGTLAVQSRRSGGTCVRIYIPLNGKGAS